MAVPKSVFITGAKTGIGLEFVRQFATCDNPPTYIFASCRNVCDAKNLQALAEAHKNVFLVDLDVANDKKIEEAVKLVSSMVGDDGLNLLINNAGVHIRDGSKFPNIVRETVNRQFDVNATSPLMLTQAFFPLLKKAADKQPSSPMSISKAAIVNISSKAGSLHKAGFISLNDLGAFGYAGSKAALNVLSRNLSFDLKEYGILTTSLCPGYVDTPMTKSAEIADDQPIAKVLLAMKKLTPDESVNLIMATMKRFTNAHNGGYFENNGEKVEDYNFASAAAENLQ